MLFIDLLDLDVHIIRRDVFIPFKIADNAIRMLAAAAFPILIPFKIVDNVIRMLAAAVFPI